METENTAQAARKVADPQPYEGVTILDMTHCYGSYAGKLFGDLGAQVIRVEPPGGALDRHRSAAGDNALDARFAFLNSSKKSVVLDPANDGDMARFKALAGRSQILFIERDGLFYDELAELRKMNPSAVITAVSPFGMTGPMADAPASDLVLQSAGGIAWMSGRVEAAPLSLPFDQATMVGSIYAATVTAIALADAERTGAGHFIDVSVQECIAHSLQNALQVWDLEGRVSIRGGEGTRDATEDIFPCRNGFVFLASPLSLGNSYKSLVGWMQEIGHPSGDVLSQERWFSREWRLTKEARGSFREYFTDFTKNYTKDQLTTEAIARRIVMGPVNKVTDVFEDEQLAYRDFFKSLSGADGQASQFPGAPYRLTPSVWDVAPAPELGADDRLISEETS